MTLFFIFQTLPKIPRLCHLPNRKHNGAAEILLHRFFICAVIPLKQLVSTPYNGENNDSERMGAMRRGMLVVIGFGVGVAMLFCLVVSVQAQLNDTEPKVYAPDDPFYPRSVMGTDLLAVRTVKYCGPFWEDGTNEEVSDVAALVIENQGGLLVVGGAVILEMGKERMIFELSFLPPGGTVLVLEKDRKLYPPQAPVTCYGWTKEEYPENPGLVTVESRGLSGWMITNHTGVTVPSIEVRYKNFDPETGMFLGGISYQVIETDLMPREVRLISPAGFTARESRIVQILQEMDR